jgi:hypothetical protein
VLPGSARSSIEEQHGLSFPEHEPGLQETVRQACPNQTVCVNLVPRVGNPNDRPDEDCVVQGYDIPNPLYERGDIFVLVNNLCDPESSG